MSDDSRLETTGLFRRARAGDREAMDALVSQLHDDLKRVAKASLQREAPDHTLQPTALVHEAYLRLINPAQLDVQDREHFLRIAGRIMRQVLVDHARHKKALIRGGDRLQVPLDEGVAVAREGQAAAVDILSLNETLERLAELDSRKAQVVELRYFSGLTIRETADVLGISPKTVEVDWYGARAWLRRELARGME